MADVAVRSAPTVEILSSIEALRVHFTAHFDRGWLAMIIDDLPIDFTTLREVRQLTVVTEVHPDDLPTIRYGVRQLQQFTLDLRRYLLPVLRERLGISRLLPHPPRFTENERIYRRLLSVTFPSNLTYLEELSHRLSELLNESESQSENIAATEVLV